jgi:hypothetical protein
MCSLAKFYTGFFCLIGFWFSQNLVVAQEEKDHQSLKSVTCKFYPFTGGNSELSHWSALIEASNGKLYIGVSTHGDASYVYEFDPVTEQMKLLADLTQLANERGKGTWTTGKIHVQMHELEGYVYFGALCEDNGPPAIDASSYQGPHWYRININDGKVEQLGLINSFWGLLGQVLDEKRRLIYGLAENGHLYVYYIDDNYTEDLGRVDDWDICRTIFIDDVGNVYGSLVGGRVWKYDIEEKRLLDLQHIRLPIINQPRSLTNPSLDRKTTWRIIEWDSLNRAAYGIIGGTNLLFRYDVSNGEEGIITPLAQISPPQFRGGDPLIIPTARLAMTISYKERKIYYLPEMMSAFDYGDVSYDIMDEYQLSEQLSGEQVAPLSYFLSYDLETHQITDLGFLKAEDGRYAYGMDGAQTGKDGKIWFVGAFEEPDPEKAAGKIIGKYPYRIGLGVYDPFK